MYFRDLEYDFIIWIGIKIWNVDINLDIDKIFWVFGKVFLGSFKYILSFRGVFIWKDYKY